MAEVKLNLNSQLCKHSYNEAVERIARLASYASSRNLKHLGFGEYFSLAEELCKKDLIVLSISIRRLAEMTKTTTVLKNLRLKAGTISDNDSKSVTQENCWDIIGNILHGVEIDVFKDIGKYTPKDILEIVNNTDEIDAALSIRSDKFHRKIFALLEFLKCLNSFLDHAEDVLSDHKIFVGSMFN